MREREIERERGRESKNGAWGEEQTNNKVACLFYNSAEI